MGGSRLTQTVDLTPGTYTLCVPIESLSSPDLTVTVTATSSSNSAHTVTQSVPVNQYYASNDPIYTQLQLVAEATGSSYTERYTIAIIVTGSSSQYVYVDDVMLSKTIGVTQYSRVEAGDFETSNSIAPSAFWTAASGSITLADTNAIHGQALVINGTLGQTNHVSQTIYNVATITNDATAYTYTVTGWMKGTAQSYAADSLFGARITILYEDSAGTQTTATYDLAANKSLTDWQFFCGTVVSEPNKGYGVFLRNMMK